MRKTIILAVLILCALQLNAQQQPAHKFPPDLISFFVGEWKGTGAFANGRKTEADLVFTATLDSNWLSCSHHDLFPGQYKATLMWGVDKNTGRFLAYNFDNFQGHRQFQSDGWLDTRLILSNSQDIPNIGLVYEHFIYQKVNKDSFKMTYETSRDGQLWKMVDYLIFTRR
jgi:hypothetical protein